MCGIGFIGCAWQWLSNLQGAQAAFVGSVTGLLFGIIALVVGALFNFWLTRRRDARIRSEEANAVAAALFGEIVLFRAELARIAKLVAGFVANHRDFNEHFLEHIHLQEPSLYKALAGKVGLLEAHVLLPIITFHNNVQSVRDWLPQLVENNERKFSYSPLTVLEPAIAGIEDILPTLNSLAASMGVAPPKEKFDMGYAYAILETERDRFAN
ncbi:hypothetical protein [Rhizobium leguminosarum]|uniref:hypothetical protein n=1 Tax=Rhizobium leguminosarum TaxID=384 RepID=UPI003F96A97D